MTSSTYADEGTIAHALAAMCLRENKDAKAYIGRVIESEDYEHAKLSPSNAHRWMFCPGSHAYDVRQHFTPRKFSMAVTDDMAEGVQVYLDNIRQYAEGHALMVEQSLPIGHITGEEGATGTGDAIIITSDFEEIQLHDLKFGRGVEVDAKDNVQLMLYGLGALELVGLVVDTSAIKRARLVIHQPRINRAPSEWDINLDDLLKFAEEAKRAAFHALQTLNEKPGALIHHLRAGEKQCRFCTAKATCPKLAQYVKDAVGVDFEDISGSEVKPVDALNHQLTKAANAEDELGVKMSATDLIEDWCRAVRAETERRLLAGVPVPGFKLVQGKRGHRKWSSEDEAEATLKSMRLKHDEMYEYSLISPTTAEKRLKDTPKRWNRLSPLITQSEGKPSVAPESDKRPALVIAPTVDDFDVVNEEESLV